MSDKAIIRPKRWAVEMKKAARAARNPRGPVRRRK